MDRPPLQLAIPERILTGGHRTTDGANADFYYIPASARDLKKTYSLQPLFSYISQTWPYWNATGGRRHVMPAEGGSCTLVMHFNHPLDMHVFCSSIKYVSVSQNARFLSIIARLWVLGMPKRSHFGGLFVPNTCKAPKATVNSRGWAVARSSRPGKKGASEGSAPCELHFITSLVCR